MIQSLIIIQFGEFKQYIASLHFKDSLQVLIASLATPQTLSASGLTALTLSWPKPAEPKLSK
jgi:hypothetical protein